MAIGVESHGDVECFEVLEGVERGLGVDLAGGNEVVHDVLVVASVGGHLLVVGGQLGNLGKSGLDQGQCQWNHGVSYGQMVTAPGLSWD